jgi:hypothetical protein
VKLADMMDPAKQAAMSEAAKLNREKDLERYDLFPMYPTCELPFPRFPLNLSLTHFNS